MKNVCQQNLYAMRAFPTHIGKSLKKPTVQAKTCQKYDCPNAERKESIGLCS